MVFGLGHKPQHIAKNIIVGLDFDGCMAYGAELKVKFAKERFGVELSIAETAEEVFPLVRHIIRALTR